MSNVATKLVAVVAVFALVAMFPALASAGLVTMTVHKTGCVADSGQKASTAGNWDGGGHYHAAIGSLYYAPTLAFGEHSGYFLFNLPADPGFGNVIESATLWVYVEEPAGRSTPSADGTLPQITPVYNTVNDFLCSPDAGTPPGVSQANGGAALWAGMTTITGVARSDWRIGGYDALPSGDPLRWVAFDVKNILDNCGEGWGDTITIGLHRTDAAYGTQDDHRMAFRGGSYGYPTLEGELFKKPHLDIVVIPEPATLVLLGLGGIGLLIRRRRRV